MIKLLFFLYIVVVFIGCDDKGFKCNMTVPNSLVNLEVGSVISDTEFIDIFNTVTPSRFTSGSFCEDAYDFSQYNTDSFGWCYYKQVDVECSTNTVTSIYNSN